MVFLVIFSSFADNGESVMVTGLFSDHQNSQVSDIRSILTIMYYKKIGLT